MIKKIIYLLFFTNFAFAGDHKNILNKNVSSFELLEYINYFYELKIEYERKSDELLDNPACENLKRRIKAIFDDCKRQENLIAIATNNYIFNSGLKISEQIKLLNQLENKTNQHIAEYGKEIQKGCCFGIYGCWSKGREVNSNIDLPLPVNRALWTLALKEELNNKKLH